MLDDVFINRYPTIDLHGEIGPIARVRVKDFIKENILLGNDTIVVIHGIGEGIVRRSVHDMLKNNKSVVNYYVSPFNRGCTIVKIKIPI